MKSIEQLLSLRENPYYQMDSEELKRLNDFLSKKSEQTDRVKANGKNSEKNIPATVINKNIVTKETGDIPTINDTALADGSNDSSDDA